MIDESVIEDIKAEITEHIEYNKQNNYLGITSGLLLALSIIEHRTNRKEQ